MQMGHGRISFTGFLIIDASQFLQDEWECVKSGQ
jgi:hypothetical protein